MPNNLTMDAYSNDRKSGGTRPGTIRKIISNSSTSNSNNAANQSSSKKTSSPALFRTVTWVLIVLCSSFLSFYCGVWTGIQATYVDGHDGKNGLAAILSEASGGGGCSSACLSEVAKEDGELQRRVEVLAQKKVKEGKKNEMPHHGISNAF